MGLNQKLKPMPTMDMADTEDMVDTADTMAASADLLKLKLPQLHTMVVMVDTEDMVDTVDTMVASVELLNHLHTMDMVDMVDTDMVDITEDKPNTHLPKVLHDFLMKHINVQHHVSLDGPFNKNISKFQN